jgi:ABC-2 type transport system permease protein
MFDGQQKMADGNAWSTYLLIGMIVYAALVNCVTTFGVAFANEKNGKWYEYLKVSPISEKAYSFGSVASLILVNAIVTPILFIVAFFYKGVTLEPLQYVLIELVMIFGSGIYLLIGLIISCFGDLTQQLSVVVFLALSLLGGIFTPVEMMPSGLQSVAKQLPTYRLADIGWSITSNHQLKLDDFLILAGYGILFLMIYYVLTSHSKRVVSK